MSLHKRAFEMQCGRDLVTMTAVGARVESADSLSPIKHPFSEFVMIANISLHRFDTLVGFNTLATSFLALSIHFPLQLTEYSFPKSSCH